jgi:hypothetical protein
MRAELAGPHGGRGSHPNANPQHVPEPVKMGGAKGFQHPELGFVFLPRGVRRAAERLLNSADRNHMGAAKTAATLRWLVQLIEEGHLTMSE